MSIKVEAAVSTQKRQNAVFNSDSVNINGKILPREVVQNGYKGTGAMTGKSFFVLSSSGIEGFADAAVAAFNERSPYFEQPGADPSDIISGYFRDSVYALGEMGHKSSEITSAIMYNSDTAVIIAKTGNSQLYTYSSNGLVKVNPTLYQNEDGASHYGLCSFQTVLPGDIFLLLSPGCAQVLNDKELDDICKVSEGSVKKIVNLISKVAESKDGKGAVSVIAVKILEPTYTAPVPPVEPAAGFEPEFNKTSELPFAEPPAYVANTANSGYDDLVINDSNNDSDENRSSKKLILAILVAAIVAVLLGCAILCMKIYGGLPFDFFKKQAAETTTAAVETTTIPETTTKVSETTTKILVTTTTPVTTTAPSTTVRSSSSSQTASSTRASTHYYYTEPEEDETERTTVPQEEEPGTTEEPVTDDPTRSDEPVTEAPSVTDPTSSSESPLISVPTPDESDENQGVERDPSQSVEEELFD